MDPAAEALAGEPRRKSGAATDAPDAAAWLAAPTARDDQPDPASPAALRALLVAVGQTLDHDADADDSRAALAAIDKIFSPADRERRKELEPCSPAKS